MRWTSEMYEYLANSFKIGRRADQIALSMGSSAFETIVTPNFVSRRLKSLGLRTEGCKEPPWADALRRKDAVRKLI